MLRRAAQLLHARLIKAPPSLARAYLTATSLICRNALPEAAAARIANAVREAGEWPPIAFRPRRVTVGEATRIALTPHLGEFDGAALFSRRLRYEPPVFAWLEREAAARYDLVIEIGANVGVYTVFFDALTRRPGARLRRIVAFEPSAEAFRRLLANLAANGATSVTAYNAAVARESGLCDFYEPQGHLTNGSLIRDFSSLFSPTVTETPALALGAQALDRFLGPAAKALVKIDVEGFEPELLDAMGPLIARRRADLLIEVLEGSAEPIEANLCLKGATRALLTPAGPSPSPTLYAHPQHRDWLVRWD